MWGEETKNEREGEMKEEGGTGGNDQALIYPVSKAGKIFHTAPIRLG